MQKLRELELVSSRPAAVQNNLSIGKHLLCDGSPIALSIWTWSWDCVGHGALSDIGAPYPHNGVLQDVRQNRRDHVVEGPRRNAFESKRPIFDSIGLGTLVSKAPKKLLDGPPFPLV